jgi:hypothetical protein
VSVTECREKKLLAVVLRLPLLVMKAPAVPEGAVPFAPAPDAGGTATFAGGVVMAPSLYVS